MADNTSQSSDVAGSFNSFNNALNLLAAGGNQVSGSHNISPGDIRGVSLFTDGTTGQPKFTDVTGKTFILQTTDSGQSNTTTPSSTTTGVATLSSTFNTTGNINTGVAASIYLPYAGAITSSFGVGDSYAEGPAWSFIHLKPAQAAANPNANPDMYLMFNQWGDLGYSSTNNGKPNIHFVSSPSDPIDDTAIIKTGVRNNQNRRDPIYLRDTNDNYHGVTSDAISGSFGCNTGAGQIPLYSAFWSSDKKSIIFSATQDTDSPNPSIQWGSISVGNPSLEGVEGWGRKQWDARVSNDGDTMTIYNDFGPGNAFANTKITIDAYPIDGGLVGRLGPTMCIPIANSDGTCTSFTFHGPSAAYYRFVATGLLAS